ncbi:MAG: hypothetical protein KIS76_18100 [Pyrinomonadaceae bacterium]|nr:hypothetical protein [Pyrinomonadaceae bacterium]
MAKKFDTNPLDPDFPEKARQTQTATMPTSEQRNGATRKFADAEEETRVFGEKEFDSYQQNFGNEGEQPQTYQKASFYDRSENQDASRKVAKVGLPENILVGLPYVPFYVGMVAGILELIFVPKSEAKVRFHAAQGLAAHLGILIVTSILGVAGFLSGFAETASDIFSLVTMIMLVIFAFKAWQGKPIHIESVESLTNWLEDTIKPQN